MGAKYLVDTNAAIDFLGGKLPAASVAWLELLLNTQQLALSVVVRIELLSWAGPPAAMQILQDFIRANRELPLDEPVIQQTIRLRQQRRVKLPDAIIAATSLVHGLPLLTRNGVVVGHVVVPVAHGARVRQGVEVGIKPT